MKNRILKWLGALLSLSMTCAPAAAEDIDLFMGSNLTTTSAAPNVVIVLDNTANWNTAFTNEKAALVSLFSALPVDKFRVGLMLFTETGSGNSGNDGAYVRAAVRLIDATSKPLYAAMLNALDQTGDKGNAGKISKSMWEAYQYLLGSTPHAGNNKKKADYSSNTDGNSSDDAVIALGSNALSTKSATTYNSPVTSGSCAKNYIIYISNGAAQDNSSDITAATSALSAAGGTTSAISLNPSGSQDNVADEWARWMKNSSLGITVYTVDINKVTTGQGPGWTALLRSMADQSGGEYFDVSSTGSQILNALQDIFSKIQAVNSVFASVSLPISVNTQGTFLNQVFVGMFRPDESSNPRWNGNLKQFKVGVSGAGIKLQDADDKSAINNQTGFITECARSYWTPSTTDADWAQFPRGDCLTVTNADQSNSPDGNVVEKGAQAQQLRANASRTVLTCNNSTCNSVVTFNTTNVTDTMLGASSTALATNYVNYAIGQDVAGLVTDIATSFQDRRLDLHGDIVHSRPVAVNFGSSTAEVAVFYGGNDGWLRAVNGNRTAALGGIAAGQEMWAFMPGEFHSKIKRLYDNSPNVSFPTSTVTYTAKDYGMDGAITAYQGLVGGASKTLLYATMRRGGRSIYGFDVTNTLTSPNAPTYKWRIGCSANGECSTGLDGIAQTWSSVNSFRHSQYSSGNTPLVVFGGGYDTCEDYDSLSSGGANHNCTGASKGHYVYVVDGDTGAVVKTFDTGGTRGIIADVIVATDSGGSATYGWTADLGGNVYRIDFTGASAAWTMTKIASLGCATTSSCTAPRKFQFVPSVVDNGDDTFNVYLGSGDREKPVTYYTASGAVANKFFYILDKPTIAAATYPGSADCGSNIICMASLYQIANDANPTTDLLATKPQGWYIDMATGEQIVTSAITIFGVVTFSTHTPAAAAVNSCTPNLGVTKVYNIDYKTAASANGTANKYEDVAGDGLPPSAVGGQVTLDNGQTVPFCIGCSADSPLEAVKKTGGSSATRPKSRLYWYIEK